MTMPLPPITKRAWIDRARAVFTAGPIRRLAHLGLCAAYLQGGLVKLSDLPAAMDEMAHFGLSPPALFAGIVIVVELAGSAMVLSGFWRWLGALGLGVFTLFATMTALRFWELPIGHDRFMAANAFFEHLGLIGGFLLVAWHDLTRQDQRSSTPSAAESSR